MITNRMNNRVEIMTHKTVKDDYGEITSELVPFTKLWTEVSKLTIKEYNEKDFSDKGTSQLTFLVDYRASLPVTREMMVKFKGNDYNIINIERDFTYHDLTKIKAEMVEK